MTAPAPAAPALLTLAGVGRRLGLSRDTVKKYRLPDPDFLADGRQPLWRPATVDSWDANRPGRRRVPRPESRT